MHVVSPVQIRVRILAGRDKLFHCFYARVGGLDANRVQRFCRTREL